MSMKAIFMYFTGEKVEALELSKKVINIGESAKSFNNNIFGPSMII